MKEEEIRKVLNALPELNTRSIPQLVKLATSAANEHSGEVFVSVLKAYKTSLKGDDMAACATFSLQGEVLLSNAVMYAIRSNQYQAAILLIRSGFSIKVPGFDIAYIGENRIPSILALVKANITDAPVLIALLKEKLSTSEESRAIIGHTDQKISELLHHVPSDHPDRQSIEASSVAVRVNSKFEDLLVELVTSSISFTEARAKIAQMDTFEEADFTIGNSPLSYNRVNATNVTRVRIFANNFQKDLSPRLRCMSVVLATAFAVDPSIKKLLLMQLLMKKSYTPANMGSQVLGWMLGSVIGLLAGPLLGLSLAISRFYAMYQQPKIFKQWGLLGQIYFVLRTLGELILSPFLGMLRGGHLGWRHGMLAALNPTAHYYSWFVNSMVGRHFPQYFKVATMHSAKMGLGLPHTMLSASTLLAGAAFLLVFMGIFSPLAPVIPLGVLAVAGISAGIVFVGGAIVTYITHQGVDYIGSATSTKEGGLDVSLRQDISNPPSSRTVSLGSDTPITEVEYKSTLDNSATPGNTDISGKPP